MEFYNNFIGIDIGKFNFVVAVYLPTIDYLSAIQYEMVQNYTLC